MNIQEAEELDYNFGRATEHQNAYALSRMEQEPEDPRIAEAVALGKFVVVLSVPAYCPRTDAIMGEHHSLVSAWDTLSEAQQAVEKEGETADCCEISFSIRSKHGTHYPVG